MVVHYFDSKPLCYSCFSSMLIIIYFHRLSFLIGFCAIAFYFDRPHRFDFFQTIYTTIILFYFSLHRIFYHIFLIILFSVVLSVSFSCYFFTLYLSPPFRLSVYLCLLLVSSSYLSLITSSPIYLRNVHK